MTHALARLRWPAAAAAVILLAYLVLRLATPFTASDLMVYRDEGAAVRHGQDLYGSLFGLAGHSHATYPPFAAVGFVPLSYLPPHLVVLAALLANLALLGVAVRLSFRLAGRAATNTEAGLAAAVLLWAEPVFTTLRYGQVNLLLLVLVLWDFVPGRRNRGVAIGIAAGLKVTPLIFVAYLVLTGRWRAARRAALAFAATIAATLGLLPHDTWRFWTHDLFDVARVGRLENAVNQSLRGLLVRMDHTRSTTAGEKLFVLALVFAGLAAAVRAYRQRGDAWGLPACAVTGLLGAPIAWSHHWVWCIPMAIVLWERARWWLPAAAIFWTFAVWAIPHRDGRELHLDRLQVAVSGWYVVFGAGFLALAAVGPTRRARRGPPAPTTDPGRAAPRAAGRAGR
jgi:alpha-1,2-mannosyltransferase